MVFCYMKHKSLKGKSNKSLLIDIKEKSEKILKIFIRTYNINIAELQLIENITKIKKDSFMNPNIT